MGYAEVGIEVGREYRKAKEKQRENCGAGAVAFLSLFIHCMLLYASDYGAI